MLITPSVTFPCTSPAIYPSSRIFPSKDSVLLNVCKFFLFAMECETCEILGKHLCLCDDKVHNHDQ